MKVIYNNLIPFKGFIAINLFGVVFARRDAAIYMTTETLQHEYIHTMQQRELLFVGFYLWYFIEWIIRIFIHGFKDAYSNISFEREAQAFEKDPKYHLKRNPYQWARMIKNEED